MGTQTSKKQQESVDPVARFMWALAFPGVSHAARLVLAALAYHADQQKLTCWPAVETLARETQVSRRGVQYALRKLETAGAIQTELSSGRSSSLYRLMIAPNRARIAPPNRARIALVNPARIAPQPRKDCAPQPRKDCAPTELLFLEQSNEQGNKRESASAIASAGARGVDKTVAPGAIVLQENSLSLSLSPSHLFKCPKCKKTWPSKFGPVCHQCKRDIHDLQAEMDELQAGWNEDCKASAGQLHADRKAEADRKEATDKRQAEWEAHPDRKAEADKVQADWDVLEKAKTSGYRAVIAAALQIKAAS